MLYLADDRSSPPAETGQLWPARALLTPTWIFALALLVANDHWLKGAGLLPGVLTGKLSDFAGMLVAPTLLAALLFVRTRSALLACHVAVAVVFTGIQLSREFADAWSGLMGVVGHPWAITCDPTDLIALPFLLLSWKLLVPEMNPGLPALLPLQRTAVGVLSMFGLWSTVATSQVDQFPSDAWYEDVYGHVYINNANDYDIALHIRPLRDDVVIDCQQVASDPGRLLDEDAFGEAVHWVLPARTNVAIDLGANECGAAWVAGEGIEPTIVFVNTDWYSPSWFSGQSFDPAELVGGGLAIEFDAEGRSSWLGDESIRFTPKTEQDEQPSECEQSGVEARIDWQLHVPNREVSVLAVGAGVDGCFELELQELILVTTPEGEPDGAGPYGEPYGFYLCAPAAAVPFVPGDVVRFTEIHDGRGGRELSVVSLDGSTLQPLLDENGQVVRQVRFMRGMSAPHMIDSGLGEPIVAVNQVSCPWQIETNECATVDRVVDLAVWAASGEHAFLPPGSPVPFADEAVGMMHTVVVGYARQLAVVDLACAEGSTQLHHDIDLAIIAEPL